MHCFEETLLVSLVDIELTFRDVKEISWANFWLNPRRLRGSDFLMRWSQGVWSEKRLIEAINNTNEYYAIPYGPSGTAPSDNVRAFELYFERLEKAGLGKIKRPDLLLFRINEKKFVNDFLKDLGGTDELPFTSERELQELIKKSIVAIECENSLWVAEKMPDYNLTLTPQKRLKGKLGLKKSAIVPTIIIKEEDFKPLLKWQKDNNKMIHVWHAFFDRAYGLSLNEAKSLVKKGLIEPTIQTFQAPSGATTKKVIFKFYYYYAYSLGISTDRPKLKPDYIEDKNGHILPYVSFEGGSLEITDEALNVLSKLK